MLRKIFLDSVSTLNQKQIDIMNGTLSSIYRRAERALVQEEETVEPSVDNIGLPAGPVFDYVGKKFEDKYYLTFKLSTDNLSAGFGYVVVKNLPEKIKIKYSSSDGYENELKGYFTLSDKNATDIEIAYVAQANQKGTFYVTIYGTGAEK